jgi:hypothetical protein
MIKKYFCEPCGYSTSRHYDITRHNESKAHLTRCDIAEKNLQSAHLLELSELEKTKAKLEIALIEIATKDVLIQHLTKDNNVKEKTIKEKEKSLKAKEKIIKEKDKRITHLTNLRENDVIDIKEDNKHYKTLNTINFLSTHRNTAPPLEELTTKTAQLCIEYDNDDLINMCISHQKANVLHTFIGNIIVDCYKKENPKDQSIWNSDVSRLTFIIRDKVKNINILAKGKNKTQYVNKWIHDKKGVTVNKRVITPILKFLRDTLDNYSKTHCKTIHAYIRTDPYKYAEEFEKIGHANKIISTIASGKLAKRISTHIGAQFQLNDRSVSNKSDDESDGNSSSDDSNSDDSNSDDSNSDDSNSDDSNSDDSNSDDSNSDDSNSDDSDDDESN